jgi:4-hydroxy-2-oxoheptanedioate aldolase
LGDGDFKYREAPLSSEIFLCGKRTNLKRFLRQGSCVYSNSPALVELMGYCGLDFCRIDNEHSWLKDQSMESMVRAATISDIVPLLRLDRDDPNVIRKALEIGAGAILIPHILTAEETEDVVRNAKFPPKGERGIGSLCFSGMWGTVSTQEMIKWSDEEQMNGVMIEDYRTMEQIDEIMAVRGLDYVFFGASDYSTSIGHPGQGHHPKVMEALKKTIEAADSHGKYVCKGVGYPWVENARKMVKIGCHMIEVGHDATILRTIWSKKGGEIKKLK